MKPKILNRRLFVFARGHNVRELEGASSPSLASEYIRDEQRELYGKDDRDDFYYAHYDAQGNVTSITDDNGDDVVFYEYDAFGNPYLQTLSSATGQRVESRFAVCAVASQYASVKIVSGTPKLSATGLAHRLCRRSSIQTGIRDPSIRDVPIRNSSGSANPKAPADGRPDPEVQEVSNEES